MLSEGYHTPTAAFLAVTPHFWLPFSPRAAAASAPSCRAAASRGLGFCAGAALGRAEPRRWRRLDLPVAYRLHGHGRGLRHGATVTPCRLPCLQPRLHQALPAPEEGAHGGKTITLNHFHAPPVWLSGADPI